MMVDMTQISSLHSRETSSTAVPISSGQCSTIIGLDLSLFRDDVADLKEAKRLLEEAVVLPLLIPDYFTGESRSVLCLAKINKPDRCITRNSAALERCFDGWTARNWQDHVGKGDLCCVPDFSPHPGCCHRVWDNVLQCLVSNVNIQVPRRI